MEHDSTSDVLVPITIELDLDEFKIQDSFTWNMNEQMITPEKFAEYFCDDVGLMPSYINVVARSIRQQVDVFKKYYQFTDEQMLQDTR